MKRGRLEYFSERFSKRSQAAWAVPRTAREFNLVPKQTAWKRWVEIYLWQVWTLKISKQQSLCSRTALNQPSESLRRLWVYWLAVLFIPFSEFAPGLSCWHLVPIADNRQTWWSWRHLLPSVDPTNKYHSDASEAYCSDSLNVQIHRNEVTLKLGEAGWHEFKDDSWMSNPTRWL